MSLRMETVRLEDVHPIRDEYGNEYTSRDYSTKANKAYVQELADSMRAKGEPDEPITLIQDGGIYYIKAGRSRYEAMKLLGTEKCQAIIDEDDTIQSVLETVIRTDTKKKYEDVEKSRYVQQLAMFGDDEYVSEVTGIEPEKVAKIRRARVVVDEAGDDMTIDRLFLIDEFSDDPEAVKQLTNCKESEAAAVAMRLRSLRDQKARQAEFVAALSLCGVPVVRDRQGVQGFVYYVLAPKPEEVAQYLPPEWEDGQVVAFLIGNRCEIYAAPEIAGDEESEEEQTTRQQADAYREAIREMDDARFAWVWANVASGRKMANLEREAWDNLQRIAFFEENLDSLPDDARAEVLASGPSKLDFVVAYKAYAVRGGSYATPLATGKVEAYQRGPLAEYVEALAIHMKDGWDPGDAAAIVEQLKALDEGE